MKQQRMRFKLTALFLFSLMALLALYGGYSVINNGNRWFSSRWNTRVTAQKENVTAGDILDRNGVVLAATVDGVRHYQPDAKDRSAAVHLLGDPQGHVSNGVESFQATYLYGFRTPVWELAYSLLSGNERKGDTVQLTVDSRLCTAITTFFAGHESTAGKRGAAVVMNYRTGEILALVSLPCFDPEQITDEVRTNPDQPFWNRATQALYAPGSTFKVITAASALQNMPEQTSGVIMDCRGGLDVEGNAIRDWGNGSHGQVTLQKAFRLSCNNAFALLAVNLGDERLRRTAEDFGFNDNFLFRDLVVENSVYPSQQNRSAFELACTGFGQSALAATPLHMCMVASAAANNGVMMQPRLLRSVSGANGSRRLSFTAEAYRRAMTEETAARLQVLMRDAVTGGTGSAAAVAGMDICGKTGSAESTMDSQHVTHGWFIGFNRDEKLPFALCVLVEAVEDGQGGGSTAAPVAADIFTYLRDHQELVIDET